MLITERYKEQIAGVISCYDRIIIQGTIPEWCYDQGMTSFLFAQKIRIFDYPAFARRFVTTLSPMPKHLPGAGNCH